MGLKAIRMRRCIRRVVLIGVVLVVSTVLIITTLIKFRPVLTAFAESEAVWVATRVANETVASTLAQYNDLCKQMVLVNYTDTGELTSVIPDSAAINALRTAITDSAMDNMRSMESLTVSIPVGTFLGADWLSGWGPMISFPISFTSTVISDITSSLEAVGMNQSAYQILIHLDISLYVITPGGRSTVGARLSYPMAEIVLLGEVPNNLTEVYGDDQSILGKIFDYGTAE